MQYEATIGASCFFKRKVGGGPAWSTLGTELPRVSEESHESKASRASKKEERVRKPEFSKLCGFLRLRAAGGLQLLSCAMQLSRGLFHPVVSIALRANHVKCPLLQLRLLRALLVGLL